MDLISLLVLLIVIGLMFWAVRTLSGAFGIPAPIVTLIYVVMVVVVCLYVLQALGGLAGGPVLRIR
jgi:hypothetical protein